MLFWKKKYMNELTCCLKNIKISLIPKMALFTRMHSVISKFLQILCSFSSFLIYKSFFFNKIILKREEILFQLILHNID